MNVIDSSGWIEFFLGTEAGRTYIEVAHDSNSLVVPTMALYEVHRFFSRVETPARRDACLNVMRRGQVIELTDARAIAASETAQQHKLALADAIHYSIAREFNATFYTQDVDYKGLPGVKYQARAKILPRPPRPPTR